MSIGYAYYQILLGDAKVHGKEHTKSLNAESILTKDN